MNPADLVQLRGFGDIVGWFIRVIIYDIIVTSIVDIFGVSRMVALFIFLGILLAISAGGYILKQRAGANADDD
ncbi:MAG: hypothetical protein EXR71_17240 [Myxococcales bacterium]|nr:hypothetical protein [Myxococcales bacterium]